MCDLLGQVTLTESSNCQIKGETGCLLARDRIKRTNDKDREDGLTIRYQVSREANTKTLQSRSGS